MRWGVAVLMMMTLPAWAGEQPPGCAWLCGSWTLDPAQSDAVETVTMSHPAREPVMPNPSYWPIVVAAGVTLTWGLVMTGKWWVPLIGLAFTAFGVFRWAFEDPFLRKER